MSENQYPTQPDHQPTSYLNGRPLDETEKPKRKRRWVLPVAMLGAGAFMGGLIGGAGGNTTTEVPVPGPTETVTAEAKPAPTQTVTAEPEVKTETVIETPQACLDALDSAEAIYGEMSQIGDVLVAYIEIIEQFDTYGYIDDSHVQKFSDAVVLNQKVNEAVASHGADFNAHADECRASSN